jgi:hypothetical protein
MTASHRLTKNCTQDQYPCCGRACSAANLSAAGLSPQLFSRPVQRADLVAIRVTQVRQIDLARRAFAKARWVFTRRAAVGHTRRMPGVALLGRLHGKADSAAIPMRSRRAIDRRGDGKRAGGAAVEIPVLVSHARANAQRAQQRVVKLL